MDVVRIASDGFNTRHGHRGAYVHRDAVNGVLRGRRGARLTALTSGGAIPDNADYDVVLEPANQMVGTVNEDFAVESLAGDVFQLGNTSYRIRRIEAGRVRVEDAQGQAPTIPFWLGEAPGRTDELSHAVSRLRTDIATHIDCRATRSPQSEYLAGRRRYRARPAEQLVDYLSSARAALGVLPTQTDDRARTFLRRVRRHAAGHSFALRQPHQPRVGTGAAQALLRQVQFRIAGGRDRGRASCFRCRPVTASNWPPSRATSIAKTVRDVLIQAMLDAPMFAARWRWIAGTSLALPRFRGGKKIAAPLQRMRADDLIAAVFPDQIACAENIVGDREIPDHPLVEPDGARLPATRRWTSKDWSDCCATSNPARSQVVARDLPMPSPLALEILTARPYAYLDDAPLEERRTQAVIGAALARRRVGASALAASTSTAIDRVRVEAWPKRNTPDELHDALLALGFITAQEVERVEQDGPRLIEPAAGTAPRHDPLALRTRACRRADESAPPADDAARRLRIWVAAERLPLLRTRVRRRSTRSSRSPTNSRGVRGRAKRRWWKCDARGSVA